MNKIRLLIKNSFKINQKSLWKTLFADIKIIKQLEEINLETNLIHWSINN